MSRDSLLEREIGGFERVDANPKVKSPVEKCTIMSIGALEVHFGLRVLVPRTLGTLVY